MKSKEKNFVSVVIYVHNAEKRIENFLETIIDVLENNFENSEVICVNDSSEDKSSALIKKIGQKALSTSVSIVNMSYFHGLELAMNAGRDMAIGDFVFEFDNTYLDFEPELVMKIYHHMQEGYDIVSASAKRKEKLSSRLFYKVFDRYSAASCKMTTESFRVISRRMINRTSSMNRTIPYRKVIYANCGLKMDIIKYTGIDDLASAGDRKEKGFRTKLAVDSLILFTEMGYSFARTMTILMMFMSVFMLAYSVAIYVMAHPVAGWTTTILFLSVAFFGLFGILTIIIKYLQLLVDLVFRRQHYSFESIEKLTR